MRNKVILFFTVLFACMVPRWYLLSFTGITFYHMRISIYLAALLFLLVSAVFMRRNRDFAIAGTKDILVFLIWFVIAALLIVRTSSLSESLESQYYLMLGLLSVFVLNFAITDMDSFKASLAGVFCGEIFHLVIGYLEILLDKHFFIVGVNDIYYSEHDALSPVSIFFNNNDYGMFIIVLLPLAIAFVQMTVKGIIARLINLILAAAGIYIVVFAQSDTLQLSLVFLILGALGVYISKRFTKAAGFLIRFSLIGAGIIVILVFGAKIWELISEVLTKERVRVNLILNGFSFLRDTYGLGIGYGNVESYLENRAVYDVYGVYYFHNWYLEILFCAGVIPFVLYILFHFNKLRILFALSKRRKTNTDNSRSEDSYDPSLYVLLSFLIFTSTCISSSSNLPSEWMWMYFGLISAYTNMLYKPSSEPVGALKPTN